MGRPGDEPIIAGVGAAEVVARVADAFIANVSRAIVNKEDEIRLCLVTMLCEGHLLIEDVPGVGKTMLAKALARSLDCTFRRIQFTPDLLPSDVTGVRAFNQKLNDFEFRPGRVFAKIVLADEINRASPKTQAALLEAMEERQVTIDGETHELPKPFMVMATQNPVEYSGTFPLPEAQLDRFLMKVKLGYLTEKEEANLLNQHKVESPMEELQPVVSPNELKAAQQAVRDVFVKPELREYIARLVGRTRARRSSFLHLSNWDPAGVRVCVWPVPPLRHRVGVAASCHPRRPRDAARGPRHADGRGGLRRDLRGAPEGLDPRAVGRGPRPQPDQRLPARPRDFAGQRAREVEVARRISPARLVCARAHLAPCPRAVWPFRARAHAHAANMHPRLSARPPRARPH